MTSVLFDTSILIDFLRQKEKAKDILSKVELGELTGFISSVTEAELYAGKESKDEEKRNAILKLITLFKKINVENKIAQTAGEFRRDYNVSLLDCIIASTAFHQKCKLWTKNKRDFEKIKEIEIDEPY